MTTSTTWKSRARPFAVEYSVGIDIGDGTSQTMWMCYKTACNNYKARVLGEFTDAPTLPYADRQAAWVKKHGIKVGSKVKVVRKFEKGESGSCCKRWNWSGHKEDMQGEILVIRELKEEYLYVGRQINSMYSFPYTALEPIKE